MALRNYFTISLLAAFAVLALIPANAHALTAPQESQEPRLARPLTGARGLPLSEGPVSITPESAGIVFQAQQFGLDAVLRQGRSIFGNISNSQLRLSSSIRARNVTQQVARGTTLNSLNGQSGSSSGQPAVAFALAASAPRVIELTTAQQYTADLIAAQLTSTQTLDSPPTATLQTAPAAAVPEPTTIALLGCGALTLLRRRHKE